jgi:FkbM family methyltransferase
MLERIDGHSFRLDLLSAKGWVLDIGCRGFNLPRILAQCGLKVIAVDPDPKIKNPNIPNVIFERTAIITGENLLALYAVWASRSANHVVRNSIPKGAAIFSVPTTNIQSLMQKWNIKQFDLVKMDCEGAEYEILADWPGPISKQISVEFHDFTGANPVTPPEDYYPPMLKRLSRWYKIEQHRKTVKYTRRIADPDLADNTDKSSVSELAHGFRAKPDPAWTEAFDHCANYWDSLFVLK